ncbi:MAG: carotenoid biosynthesis protein [Vicinamibacterales bacterium]
MSQATRVGLLAGYVAIAVVLLTVVSREHSMASTGIMLTSLVMFPVCVASAIQLLGWPATRAFVLIALSVGWFAEQMGSTDGWFFGRYTYTTVLGPRLGNVPVVIPMMWFVLTYTGYVLASLILWQRPVDEGEETGTRAHGLARATNSSFIAAMIVTAYDLGADPYLVYIVKAWVMEKTNGAWFGETVQGFVGWTFIGFAILFGFRLAFGRARSVSPTPAAGRAALVPIAVYGSGVAFQATFGYPVETRSIAIFAMGIPLLCAVHGWRQWRRTRHTAPMVMA